MTTKSLLRPIALLALLAGAAPLHAEPPAFYDFTDRVTQYVKLRQSAPRLRSTKQGKEIANRRLALAESIRQSRPGAKQGDVFTKEISASFLAVIQSTLHGPNGSNVRQTIRQGDPVATQPLAVNGAYPEGLPLTTVPPTLLGKLPQLPERLAYRIVGRDLVLQDTEARLIVDFIPAAFP